MMSTPVAPTWQQLALGDALHALERQEHAHAPAAARADVATPPAAPEPAQDGPQASTHVAPPAAPVEAENGPGEPQERPGYVLRRRRQGITPFEARSTPLTYGRAALLAMLPADAAYAELDHDVADLVHAQLVHGQHREELLARAATLDQVHAYDRRFAYAAHLRRLPGPPIAWDHDGEVDGYRPAAYRVEVTVPAWQHIGLVPWTLDGLVRYPSTPGDTFETWLWTPELRLLIEHGWPFAVRERVLFTAERERPGGDPLRGWSEWIARTYAELASEPNRRGRLREAVLWTIGAFHSRTRMRRDAQTYPSRADVPARRPGELEISVIRQPDGTYQRNALVPLNAYERAWHQPHWSSYVWSSARAAVARQALRAPREVLLGIKSDGIYLARVLHPDWIDDGTIGHFRPKGQPWLSERPLGVPRTLDALAALVVEEPNGG
jgi:hypothetical protein